MSEFVHKPSSFSLFKNTRKTADNHPDYTGTGKDLDGNDIEVAAWLKDGGKGKFMSCTFKVKGQKQQEQPKRTPAPDDGGMDIDNDQPF